MKFSYFDLRNNPKGELRHVRSRKGINTVNYYTKEIREVKPHVYLITYQKKINQKFEEGPLFKYFIVDASKDEQSASIRQIDLPF